MQGEEAGRGSVDQEVRIGGGCLSQTPDTMEPRILERVNPDAVLFGIDELKKARFKGPELCGIQHALKQGILDPLAHAFAIPGNGKQPLLSCTVTG